jgi:ubiquinone/menaquinone biosynthesis C-methylase UbiE
MGKLNLAAGNRLFPASEGWINHDRWAHRPEITATHDLEEMPWPWADDSFDEVYAFDIIEHVLHPVRFMEEIWRVCQEGAKVTVHTAWAGPQAGAREVWRDPTHRRPFHEMSMHYFDPVNGGYWHSNYGKFYTPARFRLTKVQTEPPDNILFEMVAMKAAD